MISGWARLSRSAPGRPRSQAQTKLQASHIRTAAQPPPSTGRLSASAALRGPLEAPASARRAIVARDSSPGDKASDAAPYPKRPNQLKLLFQRPALTRTGPPKPAERAAFHCVSFECLSAAGIARVGCTRFPGHLVFGVQLMRPEACDGKIRSSQGCKVGRPSWTATGNKPRL